MTDIRSGAPGSTATVAATEPPRAPRKAALASWIGSALEYYDFFLYGTAAALVFGQVFFPKADPKVGTIAALATFGVGYLARPVGAFFLGHIGDKFGRKRVLVLTILLMGMSTFLVGLLPTYNQVGIWAPVALVVLRLMQGLSAAGEQAGANSMTLEHAPPGRRAFVSSFTLGGTQMGLILATLVFLPIAALPKQQLLTWGWRIPFLLSAVVMLVGLWIRRSLPETPAFTEEEKAHRVPRLPIAELFRHNGVDVVRVVFAAFVSVVSTIFSVFTLSYAVNQVGIAKATMLTVVVLANVIAVAAIPVWALLADRFGRKPFFIGGALGSAALIWPYVWAISRENLPLVFLVGLLLSGVVYSAANGIQPALYGEMFSTRVRLSGMAVGTQIGYALGGFAPTIAAAIQGSGSNSWVPVALLTTAAATVAAISAATARETYRVPLAALGTTR
ncbi:MAG: MFS transporter [Actinomycetota bacterium]